MNKNLFNGLLTVIGIMVAVIFSSCDKDEQEYGGVAKYTPVNQPDPTPTTPTPSTFKEVMSTWCQVNPDTTVVSGQRAMYQDGEQKDSLVDREISWQVLPRLMGPDSLVVYDLDATKFVRAERTTTREGEWYASGLDSLCDITYENRFDYTYYEMEVTTHNRVGVTYFSGHRSSYETALVEVSFSRISSEWLGMIERNDSLFKRERTIPELLVSAKSKRSSGQWILSKVVLVDHFVKLVEPEPEDTTVVVPEEPEVVKADFYLKGLTKFMGAKREYNHDSKKWFDGACFTGSEAYLSIAGYFKYDGKTETLTSKTSQEVSYDVTPEVACDGVYYYDGGYYPGAYTIHTSQQKWEVVTNVNGKSLKKSYREQEAITTGIRNFQGSNTARCTPNLTVTPSVKEVRGYKVITITMQSSLHTWSVTVADEALRP